MNIPKNIWWVSNGTGSLGAWRTRKEAEAFIMSGFLPTKDGIKWSPEKRTATICPMCNKLAEADIIADLGECLHCDHMRSNIMSVCSEYKEDQY